MKTEELDRLLKKYYDGESTEEDEKLLRAFFSSDYVPEEYEPERAMFSYFMDSSEVPGPSISLHENILKNRRYGTRLSSGKFLITLTGIAAAVLIMIGSWFFFRSNEIQDTFTDPNLAYAETMKVLMEVSSKLNEGARALEPVSKMNHIPVRSLEILNKSTRIVQKNLNSLDYIQKAVENSQRQPEKNN